MKIKQASQILGMTPRNIRFYEEAGLIVMGRSENGYREYNEHDIDRLRQIKVLRDLGIGIEDIKCYFRKEITLKELMRQREGELKAQKKDAETLIELCSEIQKQDLPLSNFTTKAYESALENRHELHAREYGKILSGEYQQKRGRSWLVRMMLICVIPAFFISMLLSFNIIGVIVDIGWISYNASMVSLFTFLGMITFTVTIGSWLNRNNHFELHEDGVYFISRHTNISVLKYFLGVIKNDYLKYMEFIRYDDISMVKAGVQEEGMIMGGNHLLSFYLVIFTYDDRAIRLDSNLFYGREHFLTTLRILHDKAPKWIDPKHLAQLLEMPHEKAYKILDDYYWNKRPWHNTPFYQRLSKK